jgi:hypothetical protein
MKGLRFCGWAVIFTATLLLAACASTTPKVAETNMMSGPDATMAQIDERSVSLERRENAVVIRQAWLDERELQLALRESDLDRRENSLVINRAWLNEQQMQLVKGTPDLTKEDDLLTFRQMWTGDSKEMAAGTATTQTKSEAGRCYVSVVYPAEYKTVAVVKPIEVPKGENLPTLYQSVTEKVKVTDEQRRWEEILCVDDLTECRVIEVQRALTRGGYNPGPIDGIVGQQTMAAVNAFQRDFNLTVADSLTLETVRALDTNF